MVKQYTCRFWWRIWYLRLEIQDSILQSVRLATMLMLYKGIKLNAQASHHPITFKCMSCTICDTLIWKLRCLLTKQNNYHQTQSGSKTHAVKLVALHSHITSWLLSIESRENYWASLQLPLLPRNGGQLTRRKACLVSSALVMSLPLRTHSCILPG